MPVLAALIVGFFCGTGFMFYNTTGAMMMQAKKIASISEAYELERVMVKPCITKKSISSNPKLRDFK